MKLRKIIYAALAIFALGYLFTMGSVYVRQDGMLFLPDKEISQTPQEIGLRFEDITLTTKDGVRIAAWFVPAEHERGVVLFCHGNAGNISHRVGSIGIFHNLGLSVLIFDYRGYGKSEGSPSEKGMYLDAEAAWAYLVNARQINPEKIIIIGRSMGSAVAAELALNHKAGALVMESAFTSIPDMGSKHYPYLPIKLISRFQYDSINKVNRITIPKLFIHSPQDEVIPFEHGVALFKKAREPKEFLQITGNHNTGVIASGKIYTEGLNRFITKHFRD